MTKSPLPFEPAEPVRPMPSIARAANRLRLRASTGASVATTIMTEPVGFVGATRREAARCSLQFLAQVVASEFLTDGRASDRQHATKVRLHEHSHGVATEICRKVSRRSADAAFEAEGYRSGSGADGTFFDRAGLGVLDGREYILASNVTAANVVQISVIRFADEWIDGLDIFIARKREHVIEQRVGDAGTLSVDVSRIGVSISPSSLTCVEPASFAECIADEDRAGDFLAEEIAAVRQDRGDAGADVVALRSASCGRLERRQRQ